MKIINLTPHRIAVVVGGVTLAKFEPDGRFARVNELVEPMEPVTVDDVALPAMTVQYAPQITDLPDPTDGTLYVVSRVTAAAAARHDVRFPYGEVRDESGQVIGCRALGSFVKKVP